MQGNVQIKVQGHLDQQWREVFHGLRISYEEDTTLLSGRLTDEAQLHGVLNTIRDLNLKLISVTPIDEKELRKILIMGAGPLGSLYAYLFHQAGKDVTLLDRHAHYEFLKNNGLVLVNAFSQEKAVERVNVVNTIDNAEYDLAIVLMRKNSVKKLLPTLSESPQIKHFLFMGNNGSGFEEYLNYLPAEKVLFGFPGGGGSRIDHIIHYVDSEKPNGKRMPVTLGEIDGKMCERTHQIQQLFETSGVPVNIVDDIDSWFKYHIAFVLPLAGALLKSGNNYKLAKDKPTIRKYVLAVREAGRVLKSLGYHKSYNPKFKLFYWLPTGLLVRILSGVFNSKFSEVAMMMHVEAATDEMIELKQEFYTLKNQSPVKTPHLDGLMRSFSSKKLGEQLVHDY